MCARVCVLEIPCFIIPQMCASVCWNQLPDADHYNASLTLCVCVCVCACACVRACVRYWNGEEEEQMMSGWRMDEWMVDGWMD